MLYDDSLIGVFFNKKLGYKSIYMLDYICTNIIIKTLQELCETPLYIDANVSIKPNWQGLVERANESEKYKIEKKLNFFLKINNFETFEEIMEEDNTNTLVENI
jgi:hypothetical protein